MPEPTDEYGGRDLFAETVEACKKRGLKFYARILEPDTSKLTGRVANFEQGMSVGLDGKISAQPCRNNPQWMAWWDAIVSDTM
jgi:citrate lyase beta subunit